MHTKTHSLPPSLARSLPQTTQANKPAAGTVKKQPIPLPGGSRGWHDKESTTKAATTQSNTAHTPRDTIPHTDTDAHTPTAHRRADSRVDRAEAHSPAAPGAKGWADVVEEGGGNRIGAGPRERQARGWGEGWGNEQKKTKAKGSGQTVTLCDRCRIDLHDHSG